MVKGRLFALIIIPIREYNHTADEIISGTLGTATDNRSNSIKKFQHDSAVVGES
jgi:hypothetical protein